MGSGASEMVIVDRSGPGSAGAERALAICSARAARGQPTTLVLLGDAVWLTPEAGATGADVLFLAEDATLRGVAFDGLPSVRAVGYDELAERLLSGAHVIGAL